MYRGGHPPNGVSIYTFSNINLQSCVQQAFNYFLNVFVMLGLRIKINKYIIEICCTIFIEYIL
jgi:hypothetical protein